MYSFNLEPTFYSATAVKVRDIRPMGILFKLSAYPEVQKLSCISPNCVKSIILSIG